MKEDINTLLSNYFSTDEYIQRKLKKRHLGEVYKEPVRKKISKHRIHNGYYMVINEYSKFYKRIGTYEDTSEVRDDYDLHSIRFNNHSFPIYFKDEELECLSPEAHRS
jgi:hypothetical protein